MTNVKNRCVLIKLILAAGIAVLLLMAINYIRISRINTDFATKAYLKFHYIDKTIDTEIRDNDLKTLKDILQGFSYKDTATPGCGFDPNISITLTDGHKSITFCPACDMCEGFRIGNTNRYLDVSKEKRKLFEKIVKKHGMTFPCN